MWNRAEPLSLSSCDRAQVPINRSPSRRWIAIAREAAPRARAAKNRSISSRRMAATGKALGRAPRPGLAEAYDRSSDLGRAVADVLVLADHSPDPSTSPTLRDVAEAYAAIEAASGPAAKTGILRELLARSDPLTAKYIVKVLSGELRIGLREGLVEAAIA